MYNIRMNIINKFIKNKVFIFILSFFIFSLPIFILSASDTFPKLTNPINQNSIEGFIKVILEGVITIGVPIVAFAIVYSGFLFVSAQGKSDKIKEAKNALLYSLIGAVLLLGAWALAQVISSTVDKLK